jgi:ribose transport system ATP-binding protein
MTLRQGSGQGSGLQFSMRGIRKTFGGTVAVDGIDLDVLPGEVCALVGQNGAGKSTLMAVLAGALQPDTGEMRLEGRAYRPRSPLDARRAGVTMVYQELSLAPHLSVMENVTLGVEPVRFGFISRTSMRDVARRALDELGHGSIDPLAPASSLSVAEQQIVEIARALATGCRVLVLDEPTSSLGLDDVERLFALIQRFKAQGRAVVYISHFIEEVTRVADRVVVLRDGRIVGEGATRELAPAEIVRLMVGQPVDDLYPRRPRQPGEPILEVAPLVPGSQALTLHRGEVLGIAGLVGAGRTRLLRTIFGLEPVTSGRVRVSAGLGMGMLSEDRKGEGLAVALSIADNVTLSRSSGLGPGPLIWPRRQQAVTATWIERLDVRAAGPEQPVDELSGGNQQKVAFARLLHQDADVLILDEPTRGIDVASKAQIYALIDRLVAPAGGAEAPPLQPTRSGVALATPPSRTGVALATPASRTGAASATPLPKAVLMVSSYLPELLGLCDRIAVMRRGRLTSARPVSEWDEHALMMAATGAGDGA